MSEPRIWTHKEHMDWGDKCFRNGIYIGFTLAAVLWSVFTILGLLK